MNCDGAGLNGGSNGCGIWWIKPRIGSRHRCPGRNRHGFQNRGGKASWTALPACLRLRSQRLTRRSRNHRQSIPRYQSHSGVRQARSAVRRQFASMAASRKSSEASAPKGSTFRIRSCIASSRAQHTARLENTGFTDRGCLLKQPGPCLGHPQARLA